MKDSHHAQRSLHRITEIHISFISMELNTSVEENRPHSTRMLPHNNMFLGPQVKRDRYTDHVVTALKMNDY